MLGIYKRHVINVLNAYPGAIIVISHDEEFLDAIQLNAICSLRDSSLYFE